jgi:hypothetical protein
VTGLRCSSALSRQMRWKCCFVRAVACATAPSSRRATTVHTNVQVGLLAYAPGWVGTTATQKQGVCVPAHAARQKDVSLLLWAKGELGRAQAHTGVLPRTVLATACTAGTGASYRATSLCVCVPRSRKWPPWFGLASLSARNPAPSVFVRPRSSLPPAPPSAPRTRIPPP